MNKWVGVILVFLGVFLAFKYCAVKETADVAFSGDWNQVVSSEVSGTRTAYRLSVKADKDRFHIVKKWEDRSSQMRYKETVIYDGTQLHRKIESSDEMEASTFRSSNAKPAEVANYRFWKVIRQSAEEAGPGGRVAGRESRLLQFRGNRPDATVTNQFWLDNETRLLLKSQVSIYSKQVEMELSKETYECTNITFGPVEPSSFQKPT